MFEILKSMIKEEWRMHSTMFGSIMFALFPVLVAVFALAGSVTLPIFVTMIPMKQISLLVHYIFVLFGLSSGAFGLFGREIMNRRFGHASLIAYSSRSLPVSERKIFLNFFIKDIIYYFLLWILPFVSGFFLASLLLSINLGYSITLLLTLTLSFMIGLSLVFLLSTIYVYSHKLLAGILFLFVFTLFITCDVNIELLELLPSFLFFLTQSFDYVILSLIIIVIPSFVSIILLKTDYPEKKRRFKNSLSVLSNFLKFSRYSDFISKDFLDLNRSEGGLGKIIFSFLFPLSLVWLLLLIFLKYIPNAVFILLFSIFLGIISSSIYNWLTEFDLFTSYSFLPVKVSSVIKSKLNSYAIINSISLIILVLVTIGTKQFVYFLPALFLFLSVSSYTLSVTIYLTGLYPSVLLYNAKIFLEYLFSISPVLVMLIFLSVFNQFYLLFSPVLILISFYIVKECYKKWDRWEQPSF